MDSTAGSGHRPAVVVGATIYPEENPAFWVARGRTPPGRDIWPPHTTGSLLAVSGYSEKEPTPYHRLPPGGGYLRFRLAQDL
jgi:hypothetical protein